MATQGKARSKKKAPPKARPHRKRSPIGLNDRQLRFAAEYVIDGNATQAAIRSGYSAKSANQAGATLRANAKVNAEIARIQARLANKLDVSAERVLAELAKIAFSDVRKVATWEARGVALIESDKISDDAAAAIESVGNTEAGVKLTMHSKTRALELLGKHLGLYVDRVKIENPDDIARAIAAAQLAIESGSAFPAPPRAEKAA